MIPKLPRAALSIVLTMLVFGANALADVEVAKKGKAQAKIVLPDRSTVIERFAAKELQHHITKISGARLPIIGEKSAEPGTPIIAVGATAVAKKRNIRVDQLQLEEYVIVADDSTIVIAGGDAINDQVREEWMPLVPRNQTGTLFGVYALLKSLGVRWLWPGDSGAVIPNLPTITIKTQHTKAQPLIAQRRIRGVWSSSWRRRINDIVKVDEKWWNKRSHDFELWGKRNGLGQRMNIHVGHAYTDWYKKYHKAHPDWFARQKDGTRNWPKGWPLEFVKLCVSNAEIDDQIFKDFRQRRKKHPSLNTINVTPNDGTSGHCQCQNCRAMDAPGAMILSKGKKRLAMTDRYVRHWNRVAERAIKEFGPDVYVTSYAYSVYATPPVRVKPHSNLLIGFVGMDYLNARRNERERILWKKWTAFKTQKMFFRPNFLNGFFAFPISYIRPMAEDLRRCFDTGMIGTDFDRNCSHFASEGLTYYVLAQLLNDPNQNVDSLINEYCVAAFGPGSEQMKQYYALLEKNTERIYRQYDERKTPRRHGRYRFVRKFFDATFFKQAEKALEQARAKTRKSPAHLRRVNFVAVGLEYAELQEPVMRLADGINETSTGREELQKAIGKKHRFYKKHWNTWSINAPYMMHKEGISSYRSVFGGKIAEQMSNSIDAVTLPLKWRFNIDPAGKGKKELWHSGSFNDQKWLQLRVTLPWQKQGFPGYQGTAWYRTRFNVPDTAKEGQQLALKFPKLYGEAEVFVDGKAVKIRKGAGGVLIAACGNLGKGGTEHVVAVKIGGKQGPSGLAALVSLIKAE
jgi:Domain of unknown function (DUF4838)/Glycosyl hydrolases family 2, sugar binding domain